MRERLLGLRIDVDTHEGLRDGVPRLLDLLDASRVKATFYVAMGPDRSGLAVLAALRPGFLSKMRRTRAVRNYGLRTILSGTLLPSRPIGSAFPETLRRAREAGHETGPHAWDHRLWQDRLLTLTAGRVAAEMDKGFRAYTRALGEAPRTSAAPAWLSADSVLVHQEAYGLDFASDCRGREPFLPIADGGNLRTPQVPTTLPTLDEALGTTHEGARAFFDAMIPAALGQDWPVLTVHAELEGRRHADDFARWLEESRGRGLRCVPLGVLLAARVARGPLRRCALEHGSVPGRHGVVTLQAR